MTTGPSEDHAWVFDLVHPDDGRRRAALDRHRTLLEASTQALRWVNRVWAEAGSPKPEQPRLAAEMDRARAAWQSARARTFFGPIDLFCGSGAYASHALLFLRWERSYPQEWREAGSWSWSPWSTKELVLGRFIRGGVPDDQCSALVELVAAALNGPYRCKDWMYAPLARLVDGPDLRASVATLLHDADPLSRQRAEFVRYVLDHRDVRVRRHTWARWLAANPSR